MKRLLISTVLSLILNFGFSQNQKSVPTLNSLIQCVKAGSYSKFHLEAKKLGFSFEEKNVNNGCDDCTDYSYLRKLEINDNIITERLNFSIYNDLKLTRIELVTIETDLISFYTPGIKTLKFELNKCKSVDNNGNVTSFCYKLNKYKIRLEETRKTFSSGETGSEYRLIIYN